MSLTAPAVKLARPSSLRLPAAVGLPVRAWAAVLTSCSVVYSLFGMNGFSRPLWVRSLSWTAGDVEEAVFFPSLMWSGSMMILRRISWSWTWPWGERRAGASGLVEVRNMLLHPGLFILTRSASDCPVLVRWHAGTSVSQPSCCSSSGLASSQVLGVGSCAVEAQVYVYRTAVPGEVQFSVVCQFANVWHLAERRGQLSAEGCWTSHSMSSNPNLASRVPVGQPQSGAYLRDEVAPVWSGVLFASS